MIDKREWGNLVLTLPLHSFSYNWRDKHLKIVCARTFLNPCLWNPPRNLISQDIFFSLEYYTLYFRTVAWALEGGHAHGVTWRLTTPSWPSIFYFVALLCGLATITKGTDLAGFSHNPMLWPNVSGIQA